MERRPAIGTRRKVRTSRVATASAAIAALVGVLVLTGWGFDVPALQRLIPGTNPMVAATAIAFVLCGAALWLLRDEEATASRRMVGRALAVAAASIGLLKLAEYAFGWDLGLDRILLTADPGPFPGQMAVPTAVSFVLMGTALAILDLEVRLWRPALALALAGALPAFLSLVGRAYGEEALSRLVTGTVVMAVPTAVAFMILGVGTLSARPLGGLIGTLDSDGPGNRLARGLLPAIAAVMLLGGWLRLYGQRAGLYGTEFGAALMAVFATVALGVLILWNGRSLNRAHERSRRAEAQQIQFLDLLPGGVIVLDRERLPRYANRAAREILGFDIVPGQRQPYFEGQGAFVAGTHHAYPTDELFRRMLDGERVHLDNVEFRGPRATVALEMTGGPIHDASGRIEYAAVMFTDVTDRRRMDERVKTAEERQRAVLSSVAEGVVITDPELTVVSINPAMERLLGRTDQEVAGLRHEDALPFVDGEGKPLPRERRFLEKAVATRQVTLSRRYDVSLSVADGRRIPVSVAASPVLGPGGDLLGGVEIVRNVSHEREVDRLKSSLISTVSHELRTPLTMIQGFSELLLTQPMDEERSREALEQIHHSAARLSRLIEDLLSVSRIDAGRLEVRAAPLDVEEALGTAAAPFAHEREIQVDAAPDLPKAFADHDKVIQVLTNLLSNAVKYSEPGTPIHVQAVSNGDGVRISVEDHGVGMSEEELSRAFDKFSRFERTGGPTVGGTGLGLYITKSLVEAQGGRIWADSAPDRGTTFTFTLPSVGGDG